MDDGRGEFLPIIIPRNSQNIIFPGSVSRTVPLKLNTKQWIKYIASGAITTFLSLGIFLMRIKKHLDTTIINMIDMAIKPKYPISNADFPK
jgi:hypothetical protein